MASRRRRNDQLGRAPWARPFFRPKAVAVARAGDPPWRSRFVQELLRTVPLGFSSQAVVRPRPRPLDGFRARRARIASTLPFTGAARPLQRVRGYRLPTPLGRPVLLPSRTPCRRRAERKEVLFAQNVAGRRWGRGGGPSMRGARIGLNSQYRCK